jgi:hypothetical protein
VAYFWSVLGNNYTPVNDGWVSVSKFYQISAPDSCVFPQKIGARYVRTIPFILASKLDDVGFTTLNTFLILVNVLTGLGIFLVLNKIFPDKTLLSSVSSVLIMYFPYDGTMFWIGAFGVNLGYLLSIYALYFFICSVEDSSRAKFWVALFLMVASIRTYPGYLPVQALVLSLYLFFDKKISWRRWWTQAGLFFLIWTIGLVQFAENAISGRGREGNVADFALNGVLNGFSHAIRHLFVDAWITLLDLNFAFWGRGLVIILAAFVAFYSIYRLVDPATKTIDKDSSTSYKKRFFDVSCGIHLIAISS